MGRLVGLDYFGARYFSGAQGRWTSPDWSATPQPVPYADLSDPQTINLYAYLRNNPLRGRDSDGHCGSFCVDVIGTVTSYFGNHPKVAAAASKVFETQGLKTRVGIGRRGSIGPVTLAGSGTINSEVRVDDSGGTTGTSFLQGSLGVSIKGVGPQVSVKGTFVQDGGFVNPLGNLSGGVKLAESETIAPDLRATLTGGDDGRTSAGFNVESGVLQVGIEATDGYNGVGGFLRAIGDAIVQDVKQGVETVKRVVACGVPRARNEGSAIEERAA